jgi:hypothetical protein
MWIAARVLPSYGQAMRTILSAAAVLLMVSGSAVAGEGLIAPKGQRWLALASTKDLDTAIGIARYYDPLKARVVTSRNGWLAVIAGPYAATAVSDVEKQVEWMPQLARDALLTDGKNYREVAWEPENEPEKIEFTLGKPIGLELDGYRFEVSMKQEPDEKTPVTLRGLKDGEELFSLRVADDDFFDPEYARARAARLDPKAAALQVMISRFTGGAHCCMATWIVTSGQGVSWRAVQAETLDGGAYGLEDIDGDGFYEMVNVDNHFLYAFSSYADSFAPIQISRLNGSNLDGLTGGEAVMKRWRQDLAAMEFQARMDPALWSSNGFLAAWVANKVRLGEGEAGWKKMLASPWERETDFGPQTCRSGGEVDKCPIEDLETIAFPKALAGFLEENGYGPLPAGAGD